MNHSQDPKILIVTTRSVNPWHNLALEEYLMGFCISDADPAPERQYSAILYLWQNAHTVVIGRNQNAWSESRAALLEEDSGHLARRSTGGGAVYHDMGNLNFSIILPRSRFDLGQSFQVILDAVRNLGLDAVRSGRNDILIGDRKFSGNAFRYLRGVALHHGTIMVDTDVEPLLRYLTVSDTKLKSRAIKSVRSRVINLVEAKEDITVSETARAVTDSFVSIYGQGAETVRLEAEELERTDRLITLEERYASWDWRYGRTLEFDIQFETGRFPWGQAEILLKVDQGFITESVIYSDALDSDFFREIQEALKGVRFNSREMAEAVESLGSHEDSVGEISQKTIADDIGNVIRDRAF